MTLAAAIFGHAQAAPETIAVTHNGRDVTYRRFAAAIALARGFFQRRGIEDGATVVVCINNILEGWIARIALRSLGATTVCVRRTEDIGPLGLGALSIVTTSGEASAWGPLMALAMEGGHPLVVIPAELYRDWQAVDIAAVAPAMAEPKGAHILLTSGTTGAYKKVVYPAAIELAMMQNPAALPGVVSCGFNFPGWTITNHTAPIIPWAVGGRMIYHQGPQRWRPFMDKALDYCTVTPQMLTEVLAAPPEVDLVNERLSLSVTGGVLSEAQWRAARERLRCTLYSSYGSTEGLGGGAVTWLASPDDLLSQHIGDHDLLQVVDDQGAPVAPGQTGRVRMKMTPLITGYLGDPAATAEFFKDGYFYPGDLATYREDRRMVLQGRSTDVLNVMGAKFASLPIEAMLQDKLGLAAACIFSIPGPAGEEVHVAAQPGPLPIDEPAIRKLLATLIPDHVPLHLHTVTDFPRNTMGKIERIKLRAELLG